MKNSVFDLAYSSSIIERINKLTENSKAEWGSMSVDQMLAHCNVTYEMVYEDIHPKPNFFLKFILKLIVKNKVVSDEPYVQNGKTAPQFIIKSSKDFSKEKERLITYIQKTQELGESHFDDKESHSFGKLSIDEWNNLFGKHLEHHLSQFGL